MTAKAICFIFFVIVMPFNSFSENIFISKTRRISEVDRNLFYDYRSRLDSRKVYALSQRREINSKKIHVYPLSIPVNYGNIGLNNFPTRQYNYRSYSSEYFFKNYRSNY